MSFWVYILRCADNSYYTGHTDNLEERIAKHKVGAIEGLYFDETPGEISILRGVPDSGGSFNV